MTTGASLSRKTPPYQTVVFWPGSEAAFPDSIDDYATLVFDYLIKDGRAVAFPVLKASFQRGDRGPLPVAIDKAGQRAPAAATPSELSPRPCESTL